MWVHSHAYGNLIGIDSIGARLSLCVHQCVHCAVQQSVFKPGSVNNHSALYANPLSQMYARMCPGWVGAFQQQIKRHFHSHWLPLLPNWYAGKTDILLLSIRAPRYLLKSCNCSLERSNTFYGHAFTCLMQYDYFAYAYRWNSWMKESKNPDNLWSKLLSSRFT